MTGFGDDKIRYFIIFEKSNKYNAICKKIGSYTTQNLYFESRRIEKYLSVLKIMRLRR